MGFKNKTLPEAYESLEETIADLIWMKADPDEIRYSVERDIERALGRREEVEIERSIW